MPLARRYSWKVRRWVPRALAAFWVIALGWAALTHSQTLLNAAVAASMVYVLMRYPRFVFGFALVSVAITAAAFSAPRRRR